MFGILVTSISKNTLCRCRMATALHPPFPHILTILTLLAHASVRAPRLAFCQGSQSNRHTHKTRSPFQFRSCFLFFGSVISFHRALLSLLMMCDLSSLSPAVCAHHSRSSFPPQHGHMRSGGWSSSGFQQSPGRRAVRPERGLFLLAEYAHRAMCRVRADRHIHIQSVQPRVSALLLHVVSRLASYNSRHCVCTCGCSTVMSASCIGGERGLTMSSLFLFILSWADFSLPSRGIVEYSRPPGQLLGM